MHTQLGSPHTPHKPLLGNSLAAFPDSNEQPAALVIRPGQRHTRLLMGFFGCCGGSAHATQPADTAAKPRRHHRRHRRQRVPSHKPADGVPDAYAHSVLSEADWHDCRDNFSVGDGDHLAEVSPAPSAGQSPRHSFAVEGHHEIRSHNGPSDGGAFLEADDSDSSTSSGMGGPGSSSGPFSSCLSMVRGDSITGVDRGHRTPRPYAAPSRGKPPAGFTLPRRPASMPIEGAHNCWDEVEASTYRVRCLDYMRTKLKAPSEKSIYRLVAIDMFTTQQKAFHVAKLVHLPPTPPPVLQPDGGVLPPLLIVNVQLPEYPATLFGSNDGAGLSIVYYFVLPDDFDPVKFGNQKALGLLQRFVANGREADGQPTRERLKMIPRVVNCDEWAEKGPLSGTEYKLLVRYNEMPVLTRPQQCFYLGQNYLEIDLDVHSYTFLARKAINSFHSRLSEVVWENAFVVQGNSNDELPEQLLACARIYRADFEHMKSFEDSAAQQAAQQHPSSTPDVRAQSHISAVGGGILDDGAHH